jgi:hypothetical protein
MKRLLISFVVGLLVGVAYGLIRVKSPAQLPEMLAPYRSRSRGQSHRTIRRVFHFEWRNSIALLETIPGKRPQ